MDQTRVLACAHNETLTNGADAALTRLRAAIEADMRLAHDTNEVRRELGQGERYTDERGVRLPVEAISSREAKLALVRLRRTVVRLHRGEQAVYLTRRYPHPREYVFDSYLQHVRGMTASHWLESRPLFRALQKRAGR
jgi:hypothetical protein